MTSKDAGRPLGEILTRIGVELDEAANSVDALHVLVEATIAACGSNDAFVREAQTIDILQQHLFALASFISELAEAMPQSWRIESNDAVNRVKLSRLKERLSHMHGERDAEPHLSGDVQMF